MTWAAADSDGRGVNGSGGGSLREEAAFPPQAMNGRVWDGSLTTGRNTEFSPKEALMGFLHEIPQYKC